MSSYGHHGVSGSFPTNYGFLATRTVGNASNADDSSIDSSRINSARPPNPSMAAIPPPVSDERTALLPSRVPRIHEEVLDINAATTSGRFVAYFEELQILSKYTLPVLG